MLLEICASNIESALNAQRGGADRIEFCQALEVGGLTPNLEDLLTLIPQLSIDIFVLIRPRTGDFDFSPAEFEQMILSVKSVRNLGVKGIVSGVLTQNNQIDIDRTEQLINAAGPMSFTFHRAFDRLYNPILGLDTLIDLGVDRVLTSGGLSNAIDGITKLQQLQQKAEDKLIILPGGGIRSSNALKFKEAGFKEIHSSAIVNSNHSDVKEIARLHGICNG